MRLLHISPSYHPHIGGVEYVVKSVAERLARMGHEVTVLAGEPSIDKPVEEEVNNVSVTRWPVWSPNGAYHIPRRRSKLTEWLRRNSRNVDVIHFHSVHSVLPVYSLNVLKDVDVWKVFTPYYHGTGHTVFRRFLWVSWRYFVKRLLRYVNVVHTVSKLEAELVERDFCIKALPIENGVDEWVLSVSWSPRGYVMYSGRIERYKNIHRLGSVVRILNRVYGLDLELKVFGRGPYRESLRRYLEGLGIRFSLEEPQPFEKYIENLSQASLFGLLSEKESYPQSVNEANAIGVPVAVAEPWGRNFSGRSRTLIVSLNESDEAIAKKIADFLHNAPREPRPVVPSWSEVTSIYLERLYKENYR
mgnify:CR=1 FL=1